LQRFSAVLMARPKAWTFERRSTPVERVAFVDAQHEAVPDACQEYVPDIPAVLDVDFGHTDPQPVLPHGGAVRISPTTQTIQVL
jgi:muramoyltetrapeptide carboxypeptidase LdcA involved in peptidoglycan recycling